MTQAQLNEDPSRARTQDEAAAVPATDRLPLMERLRRSWAALSVAAAVLVAAGAGVGFAVGHHTAGDTGSGGFGQMGQGGPPGMNGGVGGPPGTNQQGQRQQGQPQGQGSQAS